MRLSRARIAVLLSGLFLIGAASRPVWKTWVAGRRAKPAEMRMASDFGHPQAALVVEPELIDLGERPAGSTVTCDLVVRNRGKVPVSTLSTRTSCTCLAVTHPVKTLEPGASTSFQVQFKLPMKPGRDAQTIFITTDEPKRARAMARIVATGVSGATTRDVGTTATSKPAGGDVPQADSQTTGVVRRPKS